MSSTLQLSTYHGEIGPFPVSSVIVSGESEAVLIDAQFTLADAHRVVALVLATGKRLTSVYVSHGDPDYYFGLGVIRAAFPDARIVASGPTVEHIAHSAAAKLATWGPQLGANGPTNVLLPNVLDGDHLDLEGHRLEIVGLDSATPDRSFVWIPDLAAVVGGVVVYGGLHLFTADTATPEARTAWGRTLEALAALHPSIVVPGHAAPGFAQDLSGVAGSREYLQVFEQAVADSTDSAELIETMTARFPDFGLPIALQLGAKVAKGEMTW
ncbi:MAG: MBL fold metallo-hydrolase [Acidimicrobiales bacterium]